MSKQERDALMARVMEGAARSASLNESMQRMGAPANWRDVPPAPVTRPRVDAWEYGRSVPQGEVSFAERAERIEAARTAHGARRRRADAEVASRERLFAHLRDTRGLDYAEAWMAEQ